MARNPLDVLLHSISGLLSHFPAGMGVNIHGKRSGRVSQIFLQGFYVLSVFNHSNGVGMSEIMKADMVQPQISDGFAVMSNERRRSGFLRLGLRCVLCLFGLHLPPENTGGRSRGSLWIKENAERNNHIQRLFRAPPQTVPPGGCFLLLKSASDAGYKIPR